MKLLNFLFSLLVFGSSADAQHFLNGSFETNTAGGTNRYNLSNSSFNNYMSDVTSYGSSAEMDIVHSSSIYGTPRTGSYCIGMSGQRDSMALKLSCPLTAGHSYTLSFYIMRPSSFATSPDTTYVGLSTSATTFGTMIYTAAPTAAISNWELRTVTFTAPNSGQYITLSAQSQSTNTWRWVDDFAIAAVSSAPQICTQPANASICSGNNTSFAVLATGSSLSYQWQVSTNGGGAWSNVSNTGIYSGATTATLNLTAATAAVNNYQYKCIITGNVSPAATTNAVTLTVGTPTFLTQPSNSSISTNANTSFSVSALATSGYQWQESTNSGSNWTNISNSGVYSGATSATLTLTTVPVSMNGYYYRCIITGTCTPGDTSNNATLTVSAGTPPSISVHPTTDTICAGANKSFSITAANTVTYQWQLSTNSGGNWNSIANTGVYSNATTATLTITGATTGMNGYQYRCIATGGTSPAATSNVATLGVRALPTISSTTGATVCAGVANAKVRAVASSGATVKWYDSATGGSLLYTGDTLTITSPTTTKTYYAGATIGGSSNNLPTAYNSNNSNKGEMFNLVVTNNITLTDMDLNLILGSSGSYELYYKVGTYVGSENNSSAWTLISTRSSVPSLGFDVPSPMGFNLSLNLAGGQTYAFYITATNVAATTGIRYTNNSGYTTLASNSDLAIAGGIGNAYPFSTVYNNRSFNGTIHYTTGSGCTSSVRTGATLTVNPQAVVTVDPNNSSILSGANTSFAITATGATTYQWQVYNGSAWSNLSNTGIYSNATTATLNLTAATTTVNGYQYRCIASNASNCADTSNTATLTITGTAPSISTHPSNAIICPGNTSFTVVASGTSLTYQWQVNDGTGWIALTNTGIYSNVATATLNLTGATTAVNTYQYRCIVTGAVSPAATSNAATLTINAAPAVTVQAVDRTICNGANTTFAITATGAGLSYQWQVNDGSGWSALTNTGIYTGALTNTLSLTAATSTVNTYQYRCVVTGTCSPTATSTARTLTINAAPAVTVQAVDRTICNGANTTFAITATGAGLSYQWQVNDGSGWNALANTGIYTGALTSTLSLTAATSAVNTYQYRCVVTGTCAPPATSLARTLTINTAPAVTVQPANSTIGAGSNTTFAITATGTSLTYQWQVNDGSGWSTLANTGIYTGVATATLNLTNVTAAYTTYQYRCVVSGACTPAATSNAATLTVNSAPAITGQPVNSAICNGANTSFTVVASNATGYQWQVNDGSGWTNVTNTGIYTGAATATLTLTGATNAVNTYQYRCEVTGLTPPNATTNAATLTINAAPAVTVQAVDRTICNGANTTFAITATGAGLSYQWQVNDGSVWSALSNTGIYTGALTNTLTLTAATSAVNTYQYRCVVTGTCSPTATSTARTLTINTAPTVTGQPANSTIGAGSNTTFAITATGTSLTYQWQVNDGSGWSTLANTGIYTGVATATLNLTNVTAAYTTYQYRCVVSGACTPAATSNAATLTVNSAPAITGQPVNSAICSGANTSFTVVASNATGYQWQVNDGSGWTNVTNTGIYTGAATATLTLTGATNAVNTYQYRCEVTGLTPPNATTNPATLTINAAPAVTVQAVDRTICPGDNTTFSVTATNATTYQWEVNNGSGWANVTNTGIYSGATTNTLTLTAATSTVNTYQYRCAVSGTCTPSATSSLATLTIQAIPSITLHPVNSTICTGGNTIFGITATGAGIAYQWQVNNGSGWNNITNTGIYSGATTNTLTLTAATIAVNTYQYRCIVSGTCTPSDTSNPATITFNAAPAVTIHPANTSACNGSNTTFSVTATGASLTYQWQVNNGSGWNNIANAGIYSGATTATLALTTVTSVSDGYQYRCVINGTCTPSATSNAATLSINSLLTINTHPGNTTVCAGNNPTFGVTASGAGLTYQWQENTGSGWNTLVNTGIYSGVTTSTLTLTGVTNTQNSYQYRCVISSTCTAPVNSNAGILAIAPAPSVTADPLNSAICSGSNTSFSITSTGSGLTYQWQENDGTGWNNLANTGIYSGATTNTLALTLASTSVNTYQYRCIVTSSCTLSDTSNAATITINTAPAITTHPSNTSTCDGNNASFSVAVAGAGLTYQWQVNNGSSWSSITNAGIYSGVTTSTLSLTGATTAVNTYQYRCVVNGTCTPSVTSNAATLAISSLLTINTHPVSTSACSGNNASFSMTATGAGVTYQWQENNGSGWSNISNVGIYSGATTSTLTLNAATTAVNTYQYRCVVSSSCTAPTNSNVATLTINVAPVINTQPINSTICEGANTSFSIAATGAGITYQWEVNNGSGWNNVTNSGIYSGTTTNVLSIAAPPASVNNYQYRCIVGGACVPGLISSVVTLTINTAPVINTQPANSIICSGTNTSFSIIATGTALNYQWQVNNGSGWNNITNAGIYTGATTNTLLLAAAGTGITGNLYRCIVSGTCTPIATSSAVTITVNTAPAINTQPVSSTICEGANTSFSIAVSGAGITYQWEMNSGSGWTNVTNGSVYNGATTNNLTLAAPASSLNGNQYRCVVGGICVPGVTSSIVTLTVNTAPVIANQPANSTICSGDNASFSVAASGTGLMYQWQVNSGSGWNNLANTGIYSGVATNTLLLTATSAAVNGHQYRCNVSGICMPAITSGIATATINTAPAVSTQPVNSTICEGGNTTFSIVAAGTGLSYQWEVHNGSSWSNVTNTGIYSGATTNTLTLTGATTAVHTYQYRCKINGSCVPGIASSAAVLTINTTPVITAQPTNSTICSGNNTSFTISATGTGLTYQWQVNNGSGWSNIANAGIYNGATTNALNLTAVTTTVNTYQYRCVVSGTCSPSATSGAATLSINGLPAIVTPPVASTICEGSNTMFSLTASGTGLGYQWQEHNGAGWNNITNAGIYSGATTATLNLTAATAAVHNYQYRCIVGGTCTPSVTSTPVTLSIQTAPVITAHPADKTICEGLNHNFTVAATGTGLNYQWQANSGSSWSNLSNTGVYNGVTTSNLTIVGIPPSLNNYQYRCVVSGTCSPAASSAPATLTVNTNPVVTTQPIVTKTICSGDNSGFSLVATGTGVGYQWRVFNGAIWTNITNSGIYGGATTNSLTITGLTAATTAVIYKYVCVVSGTCATATSDTATLVINARPAVTLSPVNKAVCDSTKNVLFAIDATGSGLTFEWQVNTGSGWNNLPNNATYSGVNTKQLLIAQAYYSMNTYQYRCLVKGSCTPDAITSAALFTVYELKTPVVTITANDTDICVGTSVTFTPTTVNGGVAPTYIWRKNGSTVGTAGTYTSTTLADNDKITCVMASTYVCPVPPTDTSNVINMKVTPYSTPAITVHSPTGNQGCLGLPVYFYTQTANGGLTPSYNWQVNGATVGGNIDTFATSTLQNGDIVKCIFTSSLKCPMPKVVTSNNIQMDIIPVTKSSIVIAAGPDTNICDQEEVTFHMWFTNGGTTPRYQWIVNSTDMPGETMGTFVTTSLSDKDIVECRFISSARCVFPEISNSLSIDVNEIKATEVGVTVYPIGEDSYTFKALPVNGGTNPEYQWYKNNKMIQGATDSIYIANGIAKFDKITVRMISSIQCVTSKMVMSNNITTGIDPDHATAVELKLYPNPNKGMFTVATDGLGADRYVELEVTNVLGKSVYRQQVFAEQGKVNHTVSLSNTNAAGAYMLNVIIEGKRFSRRFVIIE